MKKLTQETVKTIGNSRYSVAFDLWTGRDKRNYLGCILSVITKDWKKRNFLAFFAEMKARPNSANIKAKTEDEFDKIGLVFKPFSVCTDNCVTMKKAFQSLNIYENEFDSDIGETFIVENEIESTELEKNMVWMLRPFDTVMCMRCNERRLQVSKIRECHC